MTSCKELPDISLPTIVNLQKTCHPLAVFIVIFPPNSEVLGDPNKSLVFVISVLDFREFTTIT